MDGIELDEKVGSDLSDAANLVRKVVGRRDEDSDAESIVIILSGLVIYLAEIIKLYLRLLGFWI